ncbi:unnamed protein product [Discosporangium mesarthrocarpum]
MYQPPPPVPQPTSQPPPPPPAQQAYQPPAPPAPALPAYKPPPPPSQPSYGGYRAPAPAPAPTPAPAVALRHVERHAQPVEAKSHTPAAVLRPTFRHSAPGPAAAPTPAPHGDPRASLRTYQHPTPAPAAPVPSPPPPASAAYAPPATTSDPSVATSHRYRAPEPPKPQQGYQPVVVAGGGTDGAGMAYTDPQAAAEVQQRESAVRGLLHRDPAAALRKSLENPPALCKDGLVRERSGECVFLVLNAVREDQIGSLVEGLAPGDLDTLAKYVYRGLSLPRNNGVLLRWHAKVLEKGGPGCIMRVMVDRRTLL